jgi:lysophospholipase L1-like esterase
VGAVRNAVVGLALAVASLLALELGARLVLRVAPAFGDPWAGSAAVSLNADLVRAMERDLSNLAARERLYVPDRELFWRLAPDVDLTVANEVLETRGAPVTWRIRTGAAGFRGPPPRPTAGLRILALGDSCTFGFRVDEEATFAARLAMACGTRVAGGASALNAGVPGYTSHQGRLLLARLLAAERPDVVTIAFGTNDRETDPLSDAERWAFLDSTSGRVTHASGRSAVFRLLSGLLVRPAPPGTARRPRVDAAAFGANVDAMIALVRQTSARVVLLDLVFVGDEYRDALRAIAARAGIPLIDGRSTLDGAWARIEAGADYVEEAAAWRAFYEANVRAVRPVYFDADFYRRRYGTERAEQQFLTTMADPIHPNAIGHHALADALAPLVCPVPPAP